MIVRSFLGERVCSSGLLRATLIVTFAIMCAGGTLLSSPAGATSLPAGSMLAPAGTAAPRNSLGVYQTVRHQILADQAALKKETRALSLVVGSRTHPISTIDRSCVVRLQHRISVLRITINRDVVKLRKAAALPVVILQPTNVSVPPTGSNIISFTASATGVPSPTAQWMYSSATTSWTPVPGATSTTLTFAGMAPLSGDEYKAVFTNAAGSVSSQAASLLVLFASGNWSGYADIGTGFSATSASWVVPATTCAPGLNSEAAIWAGIDGWGSPTVEQDGTSDACQNGVPVYNAWYEMWGNPSLAGGYMIPLPPETYPVAPGDSISASVGVVNGVWIFQVADATANWNFTTSVVSPAPTPLQLSAEWIVEQPYWCTGDTVSSCTQVALANFNSTTFTAVSVTQNGVVGSISLPFSMATALVGTAGQVVMAPSLPSDGGTSFTVTDVSG
jgi:hypothetical protein